MEALESFAIGWCACSLEEHLKENQEEKGKPFVPHIMRIFELSDLNGPIVANIEILRKLDILERSRKIGGYESSLRKIFNQSKLDDKSRTQLISFLDSVSDYCIQASHKNCYF